MLKVKPKNRPGRGT